MHKHSLFCRAAALVLTLALTAALALTGPASRLTEDRKTSGISQLMQETANRLSLKLGASKPFCETFYGVKE
mgnify:CR=1 FL=1